MRDGRGSGKRIWQRIWESRGCYDQENQISNLGLKKMRQGLSPGMDLDNIEVSHSQRRMSTISQLCTNALRKTRSQDKVAFWRLLTSSRQSRPQASKRRKRHQASHGCILQASPSVTKRRKRHQEGCVQASQGCRYSDLAFALRVCKQHQDNGGGDGDTTTPRHKLPRVSPRHRLPRYRSRISSLFSFYISILSVGRNIYDIINYIYIYIYIYIPTAI